MKLLKDGQILGFNLYSQFLLFKSQLHVSQEGVGVSAKRQNDVIRDKIDLRVFPYMKKVQNLTCTETGKFKAFIKGNRELCELLTVTPEP